MGDSEEITKILENRKETLLGESECNSGIESGLCKPIDFTRAKQIIMSVTKKDENAEEFDSNPPRNQVGAEGRFGTKALEHLKANRGKAKLRPFYSVERRRQIAFRVPKAVLTYDLIELQMTSIIPNGGVKKLICREGKGEQLAVGNNVRINYHLYLEGNGSCVESSQRWGKPYSFQSGQKGMGVDYPVIGLGTMSMRVKEVAVFLALPQYAFGEQESEKWKLAPRKRALCIIEVLNKLPSPSDSTSILNMVSVERKLLPFSEIYDFAYEKKLDADKDIRLKHKNNRANKKYHQALNCLLDANTRNELEEERKSKLLHLLYRSIGDICSRTGQYKAAVQNFQKAIQLPEIPEAEKGLDYFGCAKSFYNQRNLDQAKLYADTAEKLLTLSDYPELLKLQRYIQTVKNRQLLASNASPVDGGSTRSKSSYSSIVKFFRRYSK